MSTVYINNFNEEMNKFLMSGVEIQTMEYSPLVIAKKKIIVPENKIIVERLDTSSALKYQPEIGTEYDRTSTGIILAR